MQNNIVIVGASVAGLSAALRIRRLSEKVNITIIEKNKDSCYKVQGLPYLISDKLKKEESLYSHNKNYYKTVYNLSIQNEHEALKIDRDNKKVSCRNINTGTKLDFSYDTLILATGFSYTIPVVSGINCKNVFIIKDISSALKIKEYYNTTGSQAVAVVGNNIIGFEIAKSLFEKGFEVSLISSDNLTRDLSGDFNFFLKNELQNMGLSVYNNAKISRFIQKRKGLVSSIKFEDGYEIETQFVILCYNPVPNVTLAKESNLSIGDNNGIKVDSSFTTSDLNIKAIGSAVEFFNPLIGKYEISDSIRSASFNGRMVADAVIKNKILKQKNIFNTKIYIFGETTVGITGVQNKYIDKNSSNYFTVTIRSGVSERFAAIDPSFIIIKITIERESNKIIQAEIAGKGNGIQRRLDILHTAIVGGMLIEQLIDLDISYTSKSSLTIDPINVLGMISSNIINGFSHLINKHKMEINENVFLIDIRNKNNKDNLHTTNKMSIKIQELRNEIHNIPKDKVIYILSNTGKDGYVAERILLGNGFEEVYNVFSGFKSIAIR